MLNRNIKISVLVLSILSNVLFISCSKIEESVNPAAPQESLTAYVPADSEVVSQSRNILGGMLNNSFISMNSYDKILDGTVSYQANSLHKSAQSNTPGINYKLINGSYIWNGNFIDPDWPDAFKGVIYCKIRFSDNNDREEDDPAKADKMYTNLKITGAFGFLNNSPYGDKTTFELEGTWTSMETSPTFSGEGKYSRRWYGLYNGKDKLIRYEAEVKINKLKLSFKNNSITASGNIKIEMDNYKAIASADGSGTIAVTVYKDDDKEKNGKILNTYKMDISERLSRLSYYLGLLN